MRQNQHRGRGDGGFPFLARLRRRARRHRSGREALHSLLLVLLRQARRQTAPPLRGPLRPRRGARQEKARRLRCGRYRGQPEPEPVNRWRALRNLAGREADLDLTVARRSPDLQGSSKLFSNAMVAFAVAARKSYLERSGNKLPIPRRRGTAYESVLVPLMDSTTLLNRFADDKMRVCDTRRSAALAFNIFLLASPGQQHRRMVTRGGRKGPCHPRRVTPYRSDNGPPLRSLRLGPQDRRDHQLRAWGNRSGTQHPSEHPPRRNDGRRHTGRARRAPIMPAGGTRPLQNRIGRNQEDRIDARLADNVFNDDSACLVVDEIDSGVFEFLLGELSKS